MYYEIRENGTPLCYANVLWYRNVFLLNGFKFGKQTNLTKDP